MITACLKATETKSSPLKSSCSCTVDRQNRIPSTCRTFLFSGSAVLLLS
uniref:Uncharacterized protein n=1 Tax=Anguilla anguilla TaxID=7936 RepID=A0A0E9WW22_ANGAN